MVLGLSFGKLLVAMKCVFRKIIAPEQTNVHSFAWLGQNVRLNSFQLSGISFFFFLNLSSGHFPYFTHG